MKKSQQLFSKFCGFVFPDVWPLGAGFPHFWPEHRIPRQKLYIFHHRKCLEYKIWSKHDENSSFKACFFPTVSVVVVRFSSVTSSPSFLSSPLLSSSNAVQLAVPIGDDGQLMSGGSCGPPFMWLSTNAVQCFLRQSRTFFRSFFAFLSYAL